MHLHLVICFLFLLDILISALISADEGSFSSASCYRAAKEGGSHRLLWLHIPKTGTSFSVAIQHQLCPDAFEQLELRNEVYYPTRHRQVVLPGDVRRSATDCVLLCALSCHVLLQ